MARADVTAELDKDVTLKVVLPTMKYKIIIRKPVLSWIKYTFTQGLRG